MCCPACPLCSSGYRKSSGRRRSRWLLRRSPKNFLPNCLTALGGGAIDYQLTGSGDRFMPWYASALVGILFSWLLTSSLWIYPHSLSYFNESIGGPLNGPLHLLGSNVDWGQDVRYCLSNANRGTLIVADTLGWLPEREMAGVLRWPQDKTRIELPKDGSRLTGVVVFCIGQNGWAKEVFARQGITTGIPRGLTGAIAAFDAIRTRRGLNVPYSVESFVGKRVE